MNKKESRKLIKNLLTEIFDAIKGYNGGLVYGFKGGFILGNYLSPEGARETTDVDLSIGTVTDFYIIVDIVSKILDKWKETGIIYSYKVKPPVEGVSSGKIDVYRKVSNNSKAFIWAGLDISIHDMKFGIIKVKDFKCYSIERMLMDKIAVMYAPESVLFRRSRDMYDIYLLNRLDYTLNSAIIELSIKDRKIDISKESTFEKLLTSEEGKKKLQQWVNNVLESDRTNSEWVLKNNITNSGIIKSVEYTLWMLRMGLFN